MSKIKVCVHGLGNIGKYSIEAIEAASDMECVGVVRRPSSIGKNKVDLREVDEFSSIEDLIKAKGKPDVYQNYQQYVYHILNIENHHQKHGEME